MNLSTLQIPRKFNDMVMTFESYYVKFYTDINQITNEKVDEYAENYLNMLIKMARSVDTCDVARCSIGVLSLYEYGYNNFSKLITIFDRLIPQIDIEYVKFTSWVAGRLINHPKVEQSNYVHQLFERLLGWIRAYGRRARFLAAVHMLEAISTSAGSDAVLFFDSLSSAVWILVSHPSMQLINATANSIKQYTRAMIRYRRGELEIFIDFFYQLCLRLLSFSNPSKKYAALKLLEFLIRSSPENFASNLETIHATFLDNSKDSALLVRAQSYVAISCLSLVDSQKFSAQFGEQMLEMTESVLLEFPDSISDSLVNLVRYVPEFALKHIDKYKRYAKLFIDKGACDQDYCFKILNKLLEAYRKEALPFEESFLKELVKSPISKLYNKFFSLLTNVMSEKLPTYLPKELSDKAKHEVESGNLSLGLEMLAGLAPQAIIDRKVLLDYVLDKSMSADEHIRVIIPSTIYKLIICGDVLSFEALLPLFQIAIHESSKAVKHAVLDVIQNNATQIIASPESLNFLHMIANDDSISIRIHVYEIMSKISSFNPLSSSMITRHSISEHFYMIKHIPGLRNRARAIRVLPALAKASKHIIKFYVVPFMEIVLSILENPTTEESLNFLDARALDITSIGIFDSIAVIATISPEQVGEFAGRLIPILCNKLNPNESRQVVLSALNLLYVLSSPEASTLQYRIMSPLIQASCSRFLATTHSRKCRMSLLRAIGAIGVLEVYRRPPLDTTSSPKNIDEKLARDFFSPSRDLDSQFDDTLLVKEKTRTQLYVNVVCTVLLGVLNSPEHKEFYRDAAFALSEVLSCPKMYMLSYFDSFVTRLLELLETSKDKEVFFLLPIFTNVVSRSSHDTTIFIKKSIAVFNKRFNKRLAHLFLDMIIAFITSLRDGFMSEAADVICTLGSIFETSKVDSAVTCEKILQIYVKISLYSADVLYLIVPNICFTIINSQTLPEVRIYCINALTTISSTVNLFLYFGQIIRAIKYVVNNVRDSSIDDPLRDSIHKLIMVLLKTNGDVFLRSGYPLISYMSKINMITPEIHAIIENCKNVKQFTPIVDEEPIVAKKEAETHHFSEDSIIVQLTTSSVGYSFQTEWLYSFMITCIASSPEPTIGCCATIATSLRMVAKELFKVAFFSCWQKVSAKGAEQISKSLCSLLNIQERTPDNNDTVITEIIKLVFFMRKFDNPIEIPDDVLARVCSLFGCYPSSLSLYSDMFCKSENTDDTKSINYMSLIDSYIQIGDWTNAIATWKEHSKYNDKLDNASFLSKLQMWDQVLLYYKNRYESSRNNDTFTGLILSHSSLNQWDKVLDYLPDFYDLTLVDKRSLSPIFCQACFYLEKWDELNKILEFQPADSIRCVILSCFNKLHIGDFDAVDKLITNAWSILASRPITFWASNQQIHRETMIYTQQLVEVLEIKKWLQYPTMRDKIESVWKQRLLSSPRDFEIWFKILSGKTRVINKKSDLFIELFQIKSNTLGNKLHKNAFNVLFNEFSSKPTTMDKVCHAIMRYHTGFRNGAISELEKLLNVKIEDNYKEICHYYIATWLLEMGEDKGTMLEVYSNLQRLQCVKHLISVKNESRVRHVALDLRRLSSGTGSDLCLPNRVIKTFELDSDHVETMRKWSFVNTELINLDPDRATIYITNSIDALAECCKTSPTFTDVVQLLHLFFEHAQKGSIFAQTSKFIAHLPAKYLLKASPQLLVQLSHNSNDVSTFVHDLLLKLMHEHYHGLIFSLIVMTSSNNKSRARVARGLYDEFAKTHPEESNEVILIRKTLLRASVTWYEKALQRIGDALDYHKLMNYDKMKKSLMSIVRMTTHPKCELQHQFLKQYRKNIDELENYIKGFNHTNIASMENIQKWCDFMQESLLADLKNIKFILLSSLSEELARKTHFKLAVPGTYVPKKTYIGIQYFVGQFTVYMSKQQPKDVIVRGEDGNYYQYLVKGHEDLRLDERIMQFFNLINGFLNHETIFKGNVIQTMSVIPLSVQHGLIQWVPGTDTLRSLVEQYRSLYSISPMLEYELLEQYSHVNFDYMMPINKQHIIETIMSEVPDTDIANYFKLKAADPESWLQQQNMFSRSTAMTSMIGYVIGLGDRHPSNLLIDRTNGRVIHIDFGDCFERASKRKFLPEVVPFRLTRMMVRALGLTGTNGLFKKTFIDMGNLLRENRRVLVMVLSIFVHEPLVESVEPAISTSISAAHAQMQVSLAGIPASSVLDREKLTSTVDRSSHEMRNRVNQKLSGTDHGSKKPLSVEEQAQYLINTAINPYNLAKMFSGWCQFW